MNRIKIVIGGIVAALTAALVAVTAISGCLESPEALSCLAALL